jgi:cholestenol delta-isomerase
MGIAVSSGDSSGPESTPIARIVSDPAFRDVLEKRYFQFFRQKTVTSTNSLMDSRFWDRIVLQMFHVEPAVKHIVLALSSLHQLSETMHDTDAALRHQRYADQHYQRALSAAQGLMYSSTPGDIDRVLIACVIFICFENVRGNYQASQIHASSGRAIMAQHGERLRRLSRRNDLNEIQQLFARLDISAMAFEVEQARYHYDMDSFLATNPNLVPDAFETVQEARAPLIDHVRWVTVFGMQVYEAVLQNTSALPMLELERLKVHDHLRRWSSHFEQVVLQDVGTSPTLVRTLRIWHLLIAIQVGAHFYGSEMRHDAFVSDYERLVVNAEEVVQILAQKPDKNSFSFELGLTIPLFSIAQRCRDPHIRRRALEALRAGPKQEGSWGYPGAVQLAEQLMLFEEQGLGAVEKASDIPEWRRVMSVDADVNSELGKAEFVYDIIPSQGHDEELALGLLCSLPGEIPEVTSSDAAIKPFSMGEMRTMKYRARFAGEEAKLLYYGNGDNVLAPAAESSDGSSMGVPKRHRPSTGIRVNFIDPSG